MKTILCKNEEKMFAYQLNIINQTCPRHVILEGWVVLRVFFLPFKLCVTKLHSYLLHYYLIEICNSFDMDRSYRSY
ncbi:hypothetical protein HanIR_Chr15g0781321 [Helianthus annuus]|nr:hypothetical protein HanIR_Chr15g0781321 [Helianthus annuus]